MSIPESTRLLDANTYTSSSKMEEETIVKMRAAGSLHLLFRDKIIKTGTVVGILPLKCFVGLDIRKYPSRATLPSYKKE
jgi:hypothetical protein